MTKPADLPRGIRNNNPGNIRLSRVKWVGQIDGADNEFVTCEHPMWGLRMIGKVLLIYHHYRTASDGSAIDTVQEVIDRWAPPSENDTDAYAAHVRDLLNVEKGEVIDLDERPVLVTLMRAIVKHENGSDPYPERWYELAAELAAIT